MKQRTQEDPQSRRSEEIQAIIDRMPTGWVGWTAALISIVMATVVALGFVISYPDTVDGRIGWRSLARFGAEQHGVPDYGFAAALAR